MIKYIYGIHDAKSGIDHIFVSLNDAYANREFSIAVNDENSLFHNFPNDFTLMRLAELDTETGIQKVSLVDVCSAADILGGVEVVQN